MTVAWAPVFLTASATVSNTVKPSCTRPPLPGVTPPTTSVPYSRICLAWNVPAEPVIPWTSSLVSFPTRTDIGLNRPSHVAHVAHVARREGDHAARPVGHVIGGRHREAGLREHLAAQVDVGPFQPHHQRH